MIPAQRWGRMSPESRDQARAGGLVPTGARGRCMRCRRRHERGAAPVERPEITRAEMLAELDLIGWGSTIRSSARRLGFHYGMPWQSFERALLRARREGDIAA